METFPRIRPPELIIQDELHLISGPLGTLSGLYETAVDVLCSAQGSKPKVIASTATIRRADAQMASLFDRGVRQFPPMGISAADSFFSVEVPPAEKGTRLYVGVTAPGTSQTTLLVRTYAAILQAVAELDGPPAVKDPYWTLIGYFNSLRVLGGARMQVQDDVNDRLDLLSRWHASTRREIEHRIELTSREPSGDIPDHLRRMDIRYPDPEALDVILATNMISVGVDINRLGLMAVMGQPQSTSEYIQATSRVGRRYPGLVITMLNAAKSRDRSHYESFRDFHCCAVPAGRVEQCDSVLVAGPLPRAARRADRLGPADGASTPGERQRKQRRQDARQPRTGQGRHHRPGAARRRTGTGEHRSRTRADHRQMGSSGPRKSLISSMPTPVIRTRRCSATRDWRTRTSRARSRPSGACVT